MKVTIGFRRAVTTDVDFLLTLRKAAMNEHLLRAGIALSEKYHLSRINEFFNDSHLILRDKHTVGLLKLGVLASSLHIRQLQVLPEYHRLGIGSYVMEVVKKQALKLNLPITLSVLLENPAKSLYLRHGFIVTEKNDFEYKMSWLIPDK
ncbi:MAG: ribosomal protein S18 acetylase RimI-like enzyme [Alteromonadaceae bacterium]|jgi:ribosomal protein S18 acetylase RimI-like enzyme